MGGGSRLAEVGAALIVSVGTLLILGVGLAFDNTIPANSDLTGHFHHLELIRTQLLPQGHLRGWSFDWFAGFPILYFYFPLPSVVGAALGYVIDPARALRIVSWLGPLSLPWSMLAFGRAIGWGRWATTGAILGGGLFLATTSHYALGGNLWSTLAGEFSYAWGLSFAVLYLAAIAREPRGRLPALGAGLLLTASILSHVLPAGAAAMASVPLLVSRPRRNVVMGSWLIAGSLSAFWTVPLALRLGQVADLGWDYVPGVSDVLPAEVYLLLPMALFGLWHHRHRPGVWTLMCFGAAGLVAAGAPQDLVMRARLLPAWFLAVHVFFGAGLASCLVSARSRPLLWAPVALLVGIAPITFVTWARGLEGTRELSTNVLEGIEAKPGWEDLQALVDSLRSLPAGQVFWEDGEGTHHWGGKWAFSLIPRWTDHTTLTGLFIDASPSYELPAELTKRLAAEPRPPLYGSASEVPVEWDPVGVLPGLRRIGSRYLITFSSETSEALRNSGEVSVLGRFGDLTLFDLGPSSPVIALGCDVEVLQELRRFRETAVGWSREAPFEAPWRVVLPGGQERLDACPGLRSLDSVDDIEVGTRRISFTTGAIGVPHLVRASYFPNWTVEGARGPYLAAPWFMMVIPEEERVELEFRTTWVEWLGWLITAGGGAVLLLMMSVVSFAPGADDPPP